MGSALLYSHMVCVRVYYCTGMIFCVCMNEWVSECFHVQICTEIHVCAYIYIYMHTHTYIHMYIHIHTLFPAPFLHRKHSACLQVSLVPWLQALEPSFSPAIHVFYLQDTEGPRLICVYVCMYVCMYVDT